MRGKILKIVIDTNLWISFLISNNFSKLERILFSNKVTLLFSDELEGEFLDVAGRPKFRRYFSHEEIQNVLTVIHKRTINIEVKSVEKVCRDPKDNFLLALAIDGKADFLITGDADLLTLENHRGVKIVTITDFLTEHLS